MNITRKSIISGKLNTMDLPITQAQYDAWISGTLIQDAMPNLSSDEREFVLSGITKEEWDETFNVDLNGEE